MAPEILPSSGRAISLLLAANPAVQDVHPAVVHQLLEFSHRYTHQVLSDALVYAEHAGRPGKLEMDDVMLAIQARVGWEMGGRVPKEFILSLATQTNAMPLPPVPEVFGVRLPPAKDCLTAVEFEVVPNKPPPEVKLFDEELVEETDEEEEDDDMEEDDDDEEMEELDVTGVNATANGAQMEDNDDLFEGDDDDEPPEATQPMAATATTQEQTMKRKLVEDDDYD